jgi:hypothetical protein
LTIFALYFDIILGKNCFINATELRIAEKPVQISSVERAKNRPAILIGRNECAKMNSFAPDPLRIFWNEAPRPRNGDRKADRDPHFRGRAAQDS